MVLQRTPKQYKHLMKSMVTNLVNYQSIITTKAKAKHLKKVAIKLLKFAKKADNGQKSALNLLKGRVETQKAHQKLKLQIIPRLRNYHGQLIHITPIIKRRKGDNAQMVKINIQGDQKSIYQKRKKQQQYQKGNLIDYNTYAKKLLMKQKQYLQSLLQQQNIYSQELLKKCLSRVNYQQWLLNKPRNQPTKYTLLV